MPGTRMGVQGRQTAAQSLGGNAMDMLLWILIIVLIVFVILAIVRRF